MNPWYFTVYHLTRLVARIFFRFRVVHPERVIQEGPVILAMNHESYLDPPFAGIGCRRAIYFLARKTLLDSGCALSDFGVHSRSSVQSRA